MRIKLLTLSGLAALLAAWVTYAAQPVIRSFNPNTGLVWTNPIPGNLSVIERSTNTDSGSWVPFFYDWGTTGLITTRLPPAASAQSFYRIAVRTNVPDPSLVMDLSFDNAFSNGTVLDISGHGNHGLRYGRPGYPTNWPSATTGPDGSQAAEFHWYVDGFGLYGKSGDYVGIPYSMDFLNLTQATITAWVHYYASINNDINYDHNATILDAGKDVPGAWNLGRYYSENTLFNVWLGSDNEQHFLDFPDVSPTGESGGWHYYSVTFSNGVLRGYFDGALFQTSSVAVTALTMAGSYIGMACWTFNATPQMDLSVDGHPNNAWINGEVDDVRIYNRALTGTEIAALYWSFDKLPPTVPTNVTAISPSPSQVQVRWSPATDNFRVTGYVIRRDGAVVGDQSGTTFVDGGLLPGTTYQYTVQAYDGAGNRSGESDAVSGTTRASGSPIEFIVDDADGPPWITEDGAWRLFTAWPGYYGETCLGDYKAIKGWSLTFQPSLPEAGTYSVYIRYPGQSDQTWQVAPSVPVDIVHSGVTNTISLNEQANYGTWFLLGQFAFDAGTNSSVRIRTVGTTNYFVLGDAVRFVK